jgi:hypothetical protein
MVSCNNTESAQQPHLPSDGEREGIKREHQPRDDDDPLGNLPPQQSCSLNTDAG